MSKPPTNKILLNLAVLRDTFKRWGVIGLFHRIRRELRHRSLRQAASDFFLRYTEYSKWRERHLLSEESLEQMRQKGRALRYRPLISIIMPTYNTPKKFLEDAIESVRGQVYEHWQLCIADDCSTEPHVESTLRRFAEADDRIEVVFRTENGHISRSSNSAIEIARGEFITFLDHDDLLAPNALYEVVTLLNEKPETDLVYSDEDKLTPENKHVEPFFKPDWSPEKLLSSMYTCHLSVYRKSIADRIGGLRPGFEGSQDYDFALRFTEQAESIRHIPKILYHWRIHPESTSGNAEAKDYAYVAGKKALEEAIQRRGEPGWVEHVHDLHGNFRVRFEIRGTPQVTVIVPTRDLASHLDQCLESVFAHTPSTQFDVLVVDNQSQEQETFDVFRKWTDRHPEQVEILPFPEKFNYSRLNNVAAEHARGDYLMFLNNDIEVITKNWLDMILEHAQRAEIGAVGCKLLFPDDTIQHAGVVLGGGEHGVALHALKHYPADSDGYFCNLRTVNNYSAVTAACLMCKKADFDRVGGFTEALSIAYNDIDFCLKLRERGKRIVWLPDVQLYHHESRSRGYEVSAEKRARLDTEANYMLKTWPDALERDPFYNPNFSRTDGNFHLAILE